MEAKAKAMKKKETFGRDAIKQPTSSIRNSVQKTEKKKEEAPQSRSARQAEAKGKRKRGRGKATTKEGKRSSNAFPTPLKKEPRDEGEEAFIKAAEEEAKAKALRMCKANPITPDKYEADKKKPQPSTKEAEKSITPALTHMIKRASNIPRRTKEAETVVTAVERKELVESQSEDDELSELPNPVACVSLLDEDISTKESMVLPLPVPVSHNTHKTPPVKPSAVESSESPCSSFPPTPQPTCSSTSRLTSSPASANASVDPLVSAGTLGSLQIASPPAPVHSSQIAAATCSSSPAPAFASPAIPTTPTKSSSTQASSSQTPQMPSSTTAMETKPLPIHAPESSSSPLPSKSPGFKCPKCSWTGKTQGVLTRHMNAKHK